MGHTRLELKTPDASDLALRSIVASDLESLRSWKNLNRAYFFYQKEISSSEQARWHEAYALRPDDYMFMIMADNRAIGCMGIRLLDDGWDVYNVMREPGAETGSGLMGRAFGLMLSFAYRTVDRPVRLKVLKINPAISWYKKNGFSIAGEGEDYFAMTHAFSQLDVSRLIINRS